VHTECVTCGTIHEPKTVAPERNPAAAPLATGRVPSALTPEPDGSHPFSFPRLVQPVLDKRCVVCHAEKIKGAQAGQKMPPQLDSAVTELPVQGWMNKTTRYTASYLGLAEPYGFTNYGSVRDWNSPKFYRTTSGAFGARRLEALCDASERAPRRPAHGGRDQSDRHMAGLGLSVLRRLRVSGRRSPARGRARLPHSGMNAYPSCERS